MPFQDPPTKSLILPDGNPALPGFDSLVMGSDLPAEMKAAGYVAALVWYHGAFDYSSSLSQAKYYFIAMQRASNGATFPSGLDIGYCWVTNPAANGTGVLRIAFQEFHDRPANTVSANLLPNNVANAILGIGTRLVMDTDNGILEFRSGDLAYPRVGMISFTNGWYNNSGDTYFWAKKTAVGTIHIQGLLRNAAATPASSRVCALPFNTYIPKSGTVFIPILSNGATNWLSVQTDGQIFVVNAISSPASFVVNGSWVVSP